LLSISKKISQDQTESSGSIRAEIGGTNQSVQQLISDIKPIWGLLESEKLQNRKLSEQLEKVEAEHSALKSKIATVPEKNRRKFGLE
jgi:predicted RNase H-like nuclease (RuvC/YqgF family)